MENPSDEELAWRETVHRAQRADDERKKHFCRPFWMIILEQIAITSWQFALLFGLLCFLFWFWLQGISAFLP